MVELVWRRSENGERATRGQGRDHVECLGEHVCDVDGLEREPQLASFDRREIERLVDEGE